MSDLISRETVISTIHNYFKSLIDKTIFDIDVVDCAKGVSEAIDSIPTAYDVDKAVEQLETGLEEILYDRCYSNDYDMGMKEVNALLDKVMKGAVKDE